MSRRSRPAPRRAFHGISISVAALALGTPSIGSSASFVAIDPFGLDPGRVVVFWGLSGDGRTLFGQRGPNAESDNEAIRWDADRGIVGLGNLPRGVVESTAIASSFDGSSIVGESDTTIPVLDPATGRDTPIVSAFVWDEVRGMRGLGRLAPGEPGFSGASAISEDGSTIIGNDVVFEEDLRTHRSQGFVFTESTGMRRLPGASERWYSAALSDVSGDGSVLIGTGFGPPA